MAAAGAEQGMHPTPDSIRDGTVRMEEHPDYAATIRRVQAEGYTIKETSGDPHVEIREVVNPEGERIRIEKTLHVRRGMRYLDLEHEVGHIEQQARYENVVPTDRVQENVDGRTRAAPNQKGVLTTWQDPIVEYHNRLTEYLRLQERGASPEVLREHAEGVNEWRERYMDKGLKGGRSPSQRAWAEQYFPDIPDLARRFANAVGGGK